MARFASAYNGNGQSKLARTFRARRGLLDRWQRLVLEKRDERRPLVWFHAPSVGEGLQARPVIDLLRTKRPDIQVAYTFFSPSAETFAQRLNVDMTDYLPFDNAHDMRALVTMLAPSALFFVKLDVWPNLVTAAKQHGVPTGLLSATVAPRSSRQGVLANLLLRDAYRALDVVGAIDDDDAARLNTMGVASAALRTTGDTRFDQVWARAQHVDSASDVLRALRPNRPTIVAGSTWPSDEDVLFRAWTAVKARVTNARLVIAPHEPTTEHLKRIEAEMTRNKFSRVRLGALLQDSASARTLAPDHTMRDDGEARNANLQRSNTTSADADVVIIDSVGVLGDAYSVADVAYVGGGFHSAGLHSVLEPAAFGAPVIFGPGFDMSREAGMLITERGARSVQDSDAMQATIVEWLTNRSARDEWGGRAKAFVERGLGAAERSVQIVLETVQRKR